MRRKMLNSTKIIVILLTIFAGSANAQEKASTPPEPTKGAKEKPAKGKQQKKQAQTKVASQTAENNESEILVQENTLDTCHDGIDNDADSYVDCDDQDCGVFAHCSAREPEAVSGPEPAPEMVQAVQEPYSEPIWRPEFGYQCKDGIDNNGDNLIDCQEPSCQSCRYCRQKMYEIPESSGRPQGLVLDFGVGMATPNFRTPSATVNSRYSAGYDEEVPFDPDMGLIGDFKAGYVFLKWLGAGINLKAAWTFASNEFPYIETYDRPHKYKYTGDKYWGHSGLFVRFQWPFQRIVPYLDVAFGYSIARYYFRIYHPEESWDDINDWDNGSRDYDVSGDDPYRRDIEDRVYRHVTFALEPGVDFFVSQRRLAIGLKAWLPVVASSHSSTDNTGALITITATPMWREKPRLREEYRKYVKKPSK